MVEPLCRRLLDLIETKADQLTKAWLADVKARPDTQTYHSYDDDELYRRAYSVYSELSQWICEKTTKADIARHYTALGRQRFEEGFALSEVLQALILTRRHLWVLVRHEGLLDTALAMHQALNLSDRTILFFDRAAYYIAVGYEQAMAEAAVG